LCDEDLVGLCNEAERNGHPRIYLGLAFVTPASAYHKRQVLLDQLRRAYPQIADLGPLDRGASPDLRPEGAFTLAIHRLSGRGGEGLAAEAGAFLRQVAGGYLRSRPALFTSPWGDYCVDRFTIPPGNCGIPATRSPSISPSPPRIRRAASWIPAPI
jgi:pyruvate-ferredoxin/flavodoxin oxidoreductase